MKVSSQQKLVLILILLFGVTLIIQNERFETFITDSIDIYIEKSIIKWNIPGLAVGIVKDGQIILKKLLNDRLNYSDLGKVKAL